MTIPHFATQQNLVFVPALLVALVGTVCICLPIVFAPGLRRRGGGRALTVAGVVVGVAALVVAGWQAGVGARTLQTERAQLRALIATRYGLHLDEQQVGSLVDGGSPKTTLPEQAAALQLEKPGSPHELKLVPVSTGSDVYDLAFGGKSLPTV